VLVGVQFGSGCRTQVNAVAQHVYTSLHSRKDRYSAPKYHRIKLKTDTIGSDFTAFHFRVNGIAPLHQIGHSLGGSNPRLKEELHDAESLFQKWVMPYSISTSTFA